MNAKQIYMKTLKFVWMKLGLGLGTVLASAILLALCTGLGMLFNSSTALVFLLVFWLAGTKVMNSLIMHYFGYLVKAGHVAIVATAVSTGQIPDNQFQVATEMVKGRFATSNVYFVVDKLVSGAVKQLQNGLQGVDNMLGDTPGISTLVSLAKMFVGISLGYVDECCLGYTFCHKDDPAFKSAADGVVIYFQNWKVLLKNAAIMTLTVIGTVIVSSILVFTLFGGVFALLGWNGFIAFILSVFVAIVIKYAFIDSYMMVKMMVSYLQVAPQTEITFDLYNKLCKLSSKFKELLNKGTSPSEAA